jgi:hypothetical protein
LLEKEAVEESLRADRLRSAQRDSEELLKYTVTQRHRNREKHT